MLIIGPKVELKEVSQLMAHLIFNLATWSEINGEDLVITGIQNREYRKDGAHAKGRAIDVSTPEKIKEFIGMLRNMDWPYLFGTTGHFDHVHIQTDGIP